MDNQGGSAVMTKSGCQVCIHFNNSMLTLQNYITVARTCL